MMKLTPERRNELIVEGLSQIGDDGLKRLINFDTKGGKLLLNGEIVQRDTGLNWPMVEALPLEAQEAITSVDSNSSTELKKQSQKLWRDDFKTNPGGNPRDMTVLDYSDALQQTNQEEVMTICKSILKVRELNERKEENVWTTMT